VRKSSAEIVLAGRIYTRVGERTALRQQVPVKTIQNPAIAHLSKKLANDRKACTAARAKLLDHYESVLRILDDLSKLLYPTGSNVPTDNPEGRMLMRILFASCADTFETFMSDLLYEIYLAKPETLKSDAPVKVRDVLDCADLQEFISRRHAKDRAQAADLARRSTNTSQPLSRSRPSRSRVSRSPRSRQGASLRSAPARRGSWL